ncbi:Ig-like domain-containing protein [Alteromonas sp. CYL-A6]|uniref:Ig-like domain-containing protein n=1 Tax=Alteromonas nitratireducens TaxID=3390813 RepID=UPI0034AE9E65
MNNKKIPFRALTLSATVSLLIGCGGSSSSAPTPETPPPPPANTAPTTENDVADTLNGAAITIDVIANDADAEGDTLTITEISDTATLGSAAIDGNMIVYTPQNLAMGVDTLTYEISDGENTATGEITITNRQSLVLSGLVTDAPVANAEVSVTVNGETFTTQADASGSYELTITVSGDDNESMLLSGNGVGEQSHISLVSSLGSFTDTLMALTGEDTPASNAPRLMAAEDGRTISSDSDASLIVSHVSTASTLLYGEYVENGGEGTFSDFSSELNDDALMALAGFIKLLADNPDYPLPEGETTLTIFSNPDTSIEEATTTYLQENGFLNEDGTPTEEHQNALNDAIEETLKDEALATNYTNDDVAGKTWAQFFSRKTLVYGGDVFTFNADGTGTASRADYNGAVVISDFEWELTDGVVSATFTSGNESIGYSYCGNEQNDWFIEQWGEEAAASMTAMCEAGLVPGYQPIITTTRVSDQFLKNSDSDGVVRSAWTSNYQYTLTLNHDAEVPVSFSYTDSATSVMKYADMSSVIAVSEAAVTESDWALYFNSQKTYYVEGEAEPIGVYDGLMYDVVSFDSDKTLSTELGGMAGTWNVAGDALSMSVGGNTYHIQPFKTFGTRLLALFRTSNEEGSYQYVAQLVPVDEAAVADVEVTSDLPVIWTAMINGHIESSWNEDIPTVDILFGFYFDEDGTFGRYYPNFDDDYQSFITDRESLNWQWSRAGNTVQMDGYREDIYKRRRQWRLLTVEDDGMMFSLESFGWLYNSEYWGETDPLLLAPRLAPVKQYNWQELYPELWENSSLSAAPVIMSQETLKAMDKKYEDVSR